jgi:thiol-disulfide isomerase/thioredoxin
MMFSIFSLLVALCVFGSVQSASVNLTHASLNSELGAHKTMIVMYYAPWCSHSKEALPLWEELSEMMAKNSQDKDIFIAKVDCVAEPDAYWQEGIKSFPTIKAYVNHNTIPIVYDGERVVNTMWRYFRLLSRQYVEEVLTLDAFLELQEAKLSVKKPLALALLEPSDSVNDNNIRNRKVDGACKQADRVTCVISRDPTLAAALAVPVPSVTVLSKFSGDDQLDTPATLEDLDSTSAADLATWLQDHSYPPIIELTSANSELIFSQQRNGFINHFLFLVHDLQSASGQRTLDTIRAVGRHFLGKGVFIYIDMTNLSAYSAEVLESLQVAVPTGDNTDASVPVPRDAVHAVVSKDSTLKFFTGLQGGGDLIEEVRISAWVEGVLAGTVEPVRTSTFDK